MATLTLIDHAFAFLAVYRSQHVVRHPEQSLPRVTLTQQKPSVSRYSVCQVLLWESLLTHALSLLDIATYFFESLVVGTTVRLLETHTLSSLLLIRFFEAHVMTEPINALFATCSRDILHCFLLPLKNTGQTPITPRDSPTKRTRTLKDLCRLRNGTRCAITGHYDRLTPADSLPDDVLVTVDLEVAHIVPFSIADRPPSVHAFIALFSGGTVPTGTVVAAAVNHPRNGILLETNAHRDFVNFRWGVHCPSPGVYRPVKINPSRGALSFLIPAHDIHFGGGNPAVEMPSAELLNLHLAVGIVLHMSGAGEVIEKLMRDEEEMKCTGGWMGPRMLRPLSMRRWRSWGSGGSGVRGGDLWGQFDRSGFVNGA